MIESERSGGPVTRLTGLPDPPHSPTLRPGTQACFSPSKLGEAVDESTANNYHIVWALRPSGRFSCGTESSRMAPFLRPSSG